MAHKEILELAADARELGNLLIIAREDPELSPDEREEYEVLLYLCAGCLCLARMLRDKLKKGSA
jgi:hypothetical protein